MNPLYQNLPFNRNLYIDFYTEDLPHFIVPWHYHSAIEIMYIVNGTGTRLVGDHVEAYSKGDVCMIGSKLPHEWRNDDQYFQESSGLRSTCICLFFHEEIFEPNFLHLSEMAQIKDLLVRSRRGIKFLGKTKERLAELITEGREKSGIEKVIHLIHILKEMAASEEYEILTSIGFSGALNSEDFERFNKVYLYIKENFTQKIRLDEVASLIGLTPTAFCRYFKARTKKTFVEYLNDMRIGHAKKLLIEGRMKVSTVCLESGFNNFSNFVETFKKSTHMLPSEYQKKYGPKSKFAL